MTEAGPPISTHATRREAKEIKRRERLEQLRVAGCSSRNVYREKATGARADRNEADRIRIIFAGSGA